METTTETTLQATATQIGPRNIMAISGGRIQVIDEHTLRLPVSSGYRVEVQYNPGPDLYTVRRIMVRGAKTWVKGEVDRVFGEDLGELAYQASCYKNVDFGGHTASMS